MEVSRTSVLLCAIALLSASASAQVAPSNPFLGQLESGLNNGTGVRNQLANAPAAKFTSSCAPACLSYFCFAYLQSLLG
jgi:hypothetical protein